MTDITRHPLHISVLESFAELRATPDAQQASFTATISRVLTDAFILRDPEASMPAFLTDAGVSILRMAIEEMASDVAPGSGEPIGPIIGGWHELKADPAQGQAINRSGRFALCEPFADIAAMIEDETLAEGGVLAFQDPIYEDSLILIRMESSAVQRWSARLGQAQELCAAA